MKTNLYHVKFKHEYNDKIYIYSVDNIEAESVKAALLIANNKLKNDIKYGVDIILKRKKNKNK